MLQETWIALSTVVTSHFFITVFTAWLFASFVKVVLHLIKARKFDFRLLVDTGRMPSSHSAFVMCLSTVVGLETGWDSPLYLFALGFAILVMNDASGVRRAAGHQARILNVILDDMSQHKHISQGRLKEFLGHTRLEVMAGATIGVMWGLFFY
ncbi:divergent PAP2 family protein [bacterium]|nr:divergent PAP2 family protein [bacterium]